MSVKTSKVQVVGPPVQRGRMDTQRKPHVVSLIGSGWFARAGLMGYLNMYRIGLCACKSSFDLRGIHTRCARPARHRGDSEVSHYE